MGKFDNHYEQMRTRVPTAWQNRNRTWPLWKDSQIWNKTITSWYSRWTILKTKQVGIIFALMEFQNQRVTREIAEKKCHHLSLSLTNLHNERAHWIRPRTLTQLRTIVTKMNSFKEWELILRRVKPECPWGVYFKAEFSVRTKISKDLHPKLQCLWFEGITSFLSFDRTVQCKEPVQIQDRCTALRNPTNPWNPPTHPLLSPLQVAPQPPTPSPSKEPVPLSTNGLAEKMHPDQLETSTNGRVLKHLELDMNSVSQVNSDEIRVTPPMSNETTSTDCKLSQAELLTSDSVPYMIYVNLINSAHACFT